MGKDWLESLEAVLVFIVPLFFAAPLYFMGFLTDVSGDLIVYPIYISCSIMVTKFNGRQLAEIGLTGKGFFPSLGNSLALVLTAAVVRLILSDLKISPDVNSWEAVAYNLFFWTLSGLGQEILFRGLLLFSFNRWKGSKVALLVSTLMFGIIHVQRYRSASGLIMVSMIGGLWGWIALKYKNIVGPIIAHSLFNFIFSFILVS